MNLYLVEQDENTGYDTYDSFVCSARTEESARQQNPCLIEWGDWGSWASSPDKVIVTEIGKTNIDEEKIIISSFNAG